MSRKRAYYTLTDETHERIIQLHLLGLSSTHIAAATGLPRTTVITNVDLYKQTGQVHKKHKGGNHKPIISDAVKQLIIDLQAADATLTLSDIHNALDVFSFAPPPPLRTISRVLQAAGFTTKALAQYAAPRNTLEMKQKRAAWCRDTGASLAAETAIFIDETPFSFCTTRIRGRSMKGVPAVTITPAIRGKNHSVIAAVSPTRGLLYYEIKITEPDSVFIRKRSKKKQKTGPKGVTREVFRSFLINLFALPLFSDSRTPFKLLFDNAAIHKGDIEDTIFQVGYTRILLSAWSPALNPIEYAFSKWKLAYRSHHPDSEAAVDDAIRQSASSITPQDCLHYFEHTQALYAKCLDMKDL